MHQASRKTTPGIFDVEIHAAAPGSAIRERLPLRFRSRFDAGFLSHGTMNFDQRGGGNRTDVPPHGHARAGTIREELLDRHGIRLAVLTATRYDVSIYADFAYASAFASAYNAALIEEFLPQDDAFLATLRINFNDPEAAVREIERWAAHPRVAGIIASTASTETPGSRRYDPIFAAAAEAGLVISYHTTQEGRGLCSPPSSAGYPSRYIEYHSGLATSAIGHAASLVTNAVFARHPLLEVLYLEGGICWALPLIWMLDAEWRTLREEVPELREPPSHYLRNHIHFTTQPIEEPPDGRDLRAVYEQIGLERNIVFSSDYPHWDFDPPDRFLPSCFTAEERERILWRNAAELYRRRAGSMIAALEESP